MSVVTVIALVLAAVFVITLIVLELRLTGRVCKAMKNNKDIS